MRKTLLITALLYCSHSIVAQDFTAIYNADSSLTGFKNAQSGAVLAPQFVQVGGNKFQDVVAVMTEEKAGHWHGYYLFRSMKKAGIDSLYMFDNAFDCENEGFIRFTDHKTGKTGVLNREGKVVVPAKYNYVSMVTNGVLVALQGAKKETDGEHYFYTGGKVSLIDTSNQVLVEDFKEVPHLNMYSLQIADQPATDTTRVSYKGVNGKYYTIQEFNKEFSQWLRRDLLPGLTKEKMIAHSFPEISYWDEALGWVFEDREKFVEKHWDYIQALLRQVEDFTFMTEGLNPYIFEGPRYNQYINNCFQAKEWRYPLISVFIGNSNEKGQLDFLRTDEGYKMIGLGFEK